MHTRLAGLAALTVLACSDEVGPVGSSWDNGPVTEAPGPSWTDPDVYQVTGLALSADGAEVFYVATVAQSISAYRQQLRAMRLADGAVRILDTIEPEGRTTLAPTPDGARLYLVAARAPSGGGSEPDRYLREAFGGTDLRLDPPPTGHLVLAPSGRKLLVTVLAAAPAQEGQREVRVLDLDSGAFTPTPCDGELHAFSPSEDAIVCTRPGTVGLSVVRLSDGVITSLPISTRCASAAAIRWTEQGVLAACSSADGLLVGNATAGWELARAPLAEHVFELPDMSFGPDGRTLAFLETECLAEDGRNTAALNACDRREGRARILDVERGEVTTLASTHLAFSSLALSADGRMVAYAPLDGGRVYFQPIGR